MTLSDASRKYRGDDVANYFARGIPLDAEAALWLREQTGRSAGWLMFGEPEAGQGEAAAFKAGRAQVLGELAAELTRLGGASPLYVPAAEGARGRADQVRQLVEGKKGKQGDERPSPKPSARRRRGQG